MQNIEFIKEIKISVSIVDSLFFIPSLESSSITVSIPI